MSYPNVSITPLTGQLARVAQQADGVAGLVLSGVAVSGQIAIGEVKTIFSLAEAEGLGLTAAYDTANSVKVNRHIKDFYSKAPAGSELNILLTTPATSMTDVCDHIANPTSHAAKLLATRPGIKLLGITREPLGSYAPTITEGIDPDVATAAVKAQALAAAHFAQYGELSVLLEARDLAVGTIASVKDFRASGQANNRVALVALNDLASWKGASVGLALGKAVLAPVQRNVGEPNSFGPEAVVTPYLSGAAWTQSLATALNAKGYWVYGRHTGLSGFYIVDDLLATSSTDDYGSLKIRRVWDKAANLSRTYMAENFLKAPLPIEGNRIARGLIASMEAGIRQAVELAMPGQVSEVRVFIDPAQNVISTSKLVWRLGLVPLGYANVIEGLVGFVNPQL